MEKVKRVEILLAIGIIIILANMVVLSYFEAYSIIYIINQLTFYKGTNDYNPKMYLIESIIIGINLVISGFLLEVAVSKIKLINTKGKKEL